MQGLHFKETFSPVARFGSIRTLLAVAVALDWEIEQLDITSAFLSRDL